MSEKGWICLYRQIRDSWIWKESKFDKAHAWIDLLLSANHEIKKVPLGNAIEIVERGSFITSEQKLSERWGWSRHKVRNFLEMLQNDSMIVLNKNTKRTAITIVNYNVYQELPTTKEQQKNSVGTVSGQRRDTNNNNNNENNVNNINNVYTPYHEIIDYLNLKAGTSYKSTSKKTQALIKARFKEKFLLDDFKTVIDKKVLEWKGTEWEKYIRPETLFGTKFENYLNQPESSGNSSTNDIAIDFDGHPYSKNKMKNICDRLLGRESGEGGG